MQCQSSDPRSELLSYGAGAPNGATLGQARQLATQAALPAIRERRPLGLRRFWGSSSASSRAPSVASQASSEQDLTEDVQMESSTSHQALRQRMARSPGSSASSDLDSAQGRPAGLSKVCCPHGALMTLLCSQNHWLGQAWLLWLC